MIHVARGRSPARALSPNNRYTLNVLLRHIAWNGGSLALETAEELCRLHHTSGDKSAGPHRYVHYAIDRGWLEVIDTGRTMEDVVLDQQERRLIP